MGRVVGRHCGVGVLYLLGEGAGEWINARDRATHPLWKRVWHLTLLLGMAGLIAIAAEAILRLGYEDGVLLTAKAQRQHEDPNWKDKPAHHTDADKAHSTTAEFVDRLLEKGKGDPLIVPDSPTSQVMTE